MCLHNSTTQRTIYLICNWTCKDEHGQNCGVCLGRWHSVKALATKPGDLSSVPGGKKERTIFYKFSYDFDMFTVTCNPCPTNK